MTDTLLPARTYPPAAPPRAVPAAGYLPAVDGAHRAEVVGQFQQVMQRFLDTQRSVMLAYLQAPDAVADVYAPPVIAPTRNGRDHAIVAPQRTGEMRVAVPATPPVGAPDARPAPPTPAPTPVQPPPRRMATPAAPPTPVVEPSLPVKENGAPHAEQPIQLPAATPKREAATPITRDDLTTRLLGIVSERTGYPTEMLGLDIDLEADLGIDSIKRVEIVGTVVRSLTLPPGVQFEMETLTGSRSLNQLLDRLLRQLSAPSAAPDGALAVATGSQRRPEGDQRPF